MCQPLSMDTLEQMSTDEEFNIREKRIIELDATLLVVILEQIDACRP